MSSTDVEALNYSSPSPPTTSGNTATNGEIDVSNITSGVYTSLTTHTHTHTHTHTFFVGICLDVNEG